MKQKSILSLDNHFSFSGLSTFKTCKEQFKIVYIDGLRKEQESIEAYMGKCVHETLEWLYNPQNRAKPYITFDRICRTYDEIWVENWHDEIHIPNYRCTTDELYTTGKRCLSNYYNKYGPIFSEKVVETELLLEFTIDGKYLFKGVIDRLDQPSKGKFVIHDYKTGKRTKMQKAAQKDLQLAMYQIAIEQHFEQVDEVVLKWHYLRKGIEVCVKHSESDILNIKKQLVEKVDEIIITSNNLSNFYPKESRLCDWCFLWEECSAKSGSNPAMKAK